MFPQGGKQRGHDRRSEVVSDTGTKKELWQDWFIHHFPKGPEDPEYILLKFRGNHATI